MWLTCNLELLNMNIYTRTNTYTLSCSHIYLRMHARIVKKTHTLIHTHPFYRPKSLHIEVKKVKCHTIMVTITVPPPPLPLPLSLPLPTLEPRDGPVLRLSYQGQVLRYTGEWV